MLAAGMAGAVVTGPGRRTGGSGARIGVPGRKFTLSRSRSRNRTFTTRFTIALSAPAFAAAAIAAGGGFSGSAAARPVIPAHSAYVGQHRAGQSAGTARAAGGHAVTAAESSALLNAKPAAAASTGYRLTRNLAIAWRMMYNRFHWRPKYQFRPLRKLWNRESSWNVHAANPYSGAYGIPQAVPGSKMSSAGPNWRSSARTQIRWGLRYIRSRYGTPRRAWAHECATGWY